MGKNFASKSIESGDSDVKIQSPKLSQKILDIIYRSQNGNSGQYDDVTRFKYLIMKIISENEDILWTLNNKEIESKVVNDMIVGQSAEYRDTNIFDYLKVPGIQSEVKNFVCFDVDISEENRYGGRTLKRNEAFSIVNIIFRTISHEQDCKTDYGINRQDLLALIIKTQFDWSNIFGNHISKIYDKSRIAENGYYYREFVYECVVPNNLLNKAENGGVGYRREEY